MYIYVYRRLVKGIVACRICCHSYLLFMIGDLHLFLIHRFLYILGRSVLVQWMVKGVDYIGVYHIFWFLCMCYNSLFIFVYHSISMIYSRRVRAGPLDDERGGRYLGRVPYFLRGMSVLRFVYFTTHQVAPCSKVYAMWTCCVSYRRCCWPIFSMYVCFSSRTFSYTSICLV